MASKLAQAAAQTVVGKERLFDGKARNFYLEVSLAKPILQTREGKAAHVHLPGALLQQQTPCN